MDIRGKKIQRIRVCERKKKKIECQNFGEKERKADVVLRIAVLQLVERERKCMKVEESKGE